MRPKLFDDRIVFPVTSQMKRDLQKLAQQDHRTVSAIVREAVRRFLHKES